ncbi:MAG: hypothetical protein HY660_02120 [Armatimonadetes bacterium]|nr:hypothetical protein [Armatimonadota bacterium]
MAGAIAVTPSVGHDPQQLVAALKRTLEQAGAGAHVHGAAVAVLLALGLVAIVRATTTGEGRPLVEALVRLALAGWAVEAAPSISAHAALLFANLSNAGFQALSGVVSRPALESALREFAAAAESLTETLVGGQAAGGPLGNLPVTAALPRVAETISSLTHRGVATIGLGMGLLFAAYYVLSFWARLVLMVSSLLAPLSFACLAHPRTDHLGWLWVRTTLRACLTIFLGNLVLTAAVYLGILRPLEEFRQAAPMERLAQLALPVSAVAALGFGIIALLKVEGIAAGWIEGGVASVRTSLLAVWSESRAAGAGAGVSASPSVAPPLVHTGLPVPWESAGEPRPWQASAPWQAPMPDPLFPPPGGSRWR